MARIKKYSPTIEPHLKYYETLVMDNEPNSQYFRITEFKDTFTGGKNGFLIEGSEYLMETTEIKIEILDVEGNPIYFEPGQGIPQYYEGVSKVVAVYVYEDTPIGLANITILGEAKKYFNENNTLVDIPDQWKGVYNVKWEKTFKVNRLLSNEEKVRFYKRPTVNITEIVKPLFTTQLNTVTQKGLVSGTPITPTEGQSLAGYTLPTLYKLKIEDTSAWTGSVAGTYLELFDLGYSPLAKELINKKELIVSTPYTENGLVASFVNQAYTASFNYLEGINLTASALTGSFAKINISDLTTFTGDVARVKIFRKSQSAVGDYQFVQEIKLESNELLIDLESQTAISDTYGLFTDSVIQKYWVTSSNSLTASFNQDYLYDSVKLSSNTSKYFYTSKSLSTTETKEYTLNFNVRVSGSINSSNYIRAFLSGSKKSTYGTTTSIIGVEQDITKIYSSDLLLQKTTSTDNIKAQQIDNPKLYFEIIGNNWHISNVSFTAAQETAFSPDEITFIETVPRSLPVETFDYRFEFYDINNNYIPVLVDKQKTFNGGNLQNLQKSLKLNPTATYFQFDSGSNPIDPKIISFNITKNLLTGSVTFTSQSIDFFGNVLSSSQYAGGNYPGLLSNINGAIPYLSVQNFTGSRNDINVQYLQITGNCEGVTDTIVITKVLDGFGGVQHIIRPYRGTQIRNSSTSSLEIQAVRIDGINDIELSSTTQPGKGFNLIQLHVLSGSNPNQKFINLSKAASSGYISGLSAGTLGSGELNYNAIFNRDSIDKRTIVYLISSASAAIGLASATSGSVLTSIILEDLQDGLGTGYINYTTDTFTINPRTQTVFTPTTSSVTASFYARGTETNPILASIKVYPSMSVDSDYQSHYYLYYTTNAVDSTISISAVDEKKNFIKTGAIGTYTSVSESKILNVTFVYTEPYTNATVNLDKSFTIVPQGKPGDESIIFEVTPSTVALGANAKGVVNTYAPADTELKLKQGARYLEFKNTKQAGTFWTASISASNITIGNLNLTNTSSLLLTTQSNLTNLSGSITYDLEIHPYYTSSYYTQSYVQNFTKIVDGAPPIQVQITPSVLSLSGDENGNVKNYASANTTIRLKEGNDYLIYTSSGVPGTFQTASVNTNNITIAKLTGSKQDTTLLFVTGYSGMEGNRTSASVDYNFIVYPYSLLPGHITGSIAITGSQTFSKVNDGRTARSVSLLATSQTVNFDGDGANPNPASIDLTATAFNTTGSIYYTFYKDDIVQYGPTNASNIYTIPGGDATSPGGTAAWKVVIMDGGMSANVSASAQTTISGIKAGAEAYNVVLTNENSSVVYKVSGQLALAGTGTNIRVYKGTTELTPAAIYGPITYDDITGDPIGTIGQFSASIESYSSYLTLGSPLVNLTAIPAYTPDITDWSYPTTNQTATIVYKVDIENGRATFYKTQSLAVQFEGNTGPGIVMRGVWSASLDYIGSVETTNYRRDAVIYPDPAISGGETTYYAAISGSGPYTNNLNGNPVGYHAPSGTTANNAWWQYLGTQEFFIAAKIAIFDESYVKNTLNVGTKNGTGAFANIVLAGGRNDPYMAMGQTGTQGASGDQTSTGVIGYNRPGIFMGIYEDGANGTTGRFSIKNSLGTKALTWDGDTLTIKGAIRQTAAGVNEGAIRGAWTNAFTYYQNDIVTYNGQSWQCTSDPSHIANTSGGATNGPPGTGPWIVAAAAGTSGTAGSGGANGANGANGPGVVYRGLWAQFEADGTTAKTYYKTSTRQDVVQGSDGQYYLAQSTHNTTAGSGGTSTRPIDGGSYSTYWAAFGATFSSIATGTLISEQSYVKNTLNVGTNTAGNAANIAIVGGISTPYISVGQGTQGYANPGIYLGNNAGNYSLSLTNSDSSKYLQWNGSNLSLKGDVTAINGYIGGWKITGNQLQSNDGAILLDAGTDSITVFDSGGALRFLANTDTSLPTINDGGGGSVSFSSSTPLSETTTNSVTNTSGYVYVYNDAGTTFTPTTSAKHIFKYIYSPSSIYNSYAEAWGEAVSYLQVSLQIRTAANGGGTLIAQSNYMYANAYGTIDTNSGYYRSVIGSTLITLSDGTSKMAKDILPNESILAWDSINNKFTNGIISEIKSRNVDDFYLVICDGNEIKVSDTHKFWTDVYPNEISVTDLIVGVSKIYVKIGDSIELKIVDNIEKIYKTDKVYSFSVPTHHNYISNNIISHNFPPANGNYIFGGDKNYIPKPQTLAATANLSAIPYYVTIQIGYYIYSADTINDPTYGQDSYATARFTEPGTTVSIEQVSAGTIANGGGFQAAASSKRYLKLSTVLSEYDSKGAAANLTAGVESKGALYLSGNILENDGGTPPKYFGYGKAFTESSYWYGYPAAVKAFGTLNYTSSGGANQGNINYYNITNSFNCNATPGLTGGGKYMSIIFLNDIGTTNYNVTLTPRFGTTGWGATVQIYSKSTSGFTYRIVDYGSGEATLGSNGNTGTYVDFQVMAL
jgi:hypothetical protein